jgi:hypothetical protein
MRDNSQDVPGIPTRRRSWRRPLAVAAAVVAASGLVFTGIAVSQSTPRHGDSIPNITLVENQIKAYYGDTVVGTDHLPSSDGNYAHEVEGLAAKAQHYLAHAHVRQGQPAVVFDVDDTTLNTYNYEIFSSFAYNPVTNADYVNNQRFPAVFGMPALVNWASTHGYTVFFLTGRPEAQRAGTEGNLGKVGYQAPADATHLYLRNKTAPPAYLPCEPTCTTIQYKSGTRAHIESLGYHIVANFGDQFSDLDGGHADKTFKMPNPMYYLP